MIVALATPAFGAVDYTVTVLSGQSTSVTVNDADFGSLKGGESNEIVGSLTLTNVGDMDATVEAAFTTDVSGTYGMVSGTDVIAASNFQLGEDSSEVALNDDESYATMTGTVPQAGSVNYDAILNVPASAVAGSYTGTIELQFSDA